MSIHTLYSQNSKSTPWFNKVGNAQIKWSLPKGLWRVCKKVPNCFQPYDSMIPLKTLFILQNRIKACYLLLSLGQHKVLTKSISSSRPVNCSWQSKSLLARVVYTETFMHGSIFLIFSCFIQRSLELSISEERGTLWYHFSKVGIWQSKTQSFLLSTSSIEFSHLITKVP